MIKKERWCLVIPILSHYFNQVYFYEDKSLSLEQVENESEKNFDIKKVCYTISTNAQNVKLLNFK